MYNVFLIDLKFVYNFQLNPTGIIVKEEICIDEDKDKDTEKVLYVGVHILFVNNVLPLCF